MVLQSNRTIFLADCESFYASVEKAEHPEYYEQPLAVAGDPKQRSGIILAACPIAKRAGVTTAERLGEALKKCPKLIIVQPRMQYYIDVSLLITNIYRQFTDMVEMYSIDEQFLDVSASLSLFGDPSRLAQLIQQHVFLQTGIKVRIGISSNKALAKMATDIWAKKNEQGIFTLPSPEITHLLWPQPIYKLFGVGSRITKHFTKLGLLTIGDLARTPLPNLKDKLRLRFGKQSDILAQVLWNTANGIDQSPVTPDTFDKLPKSVGHMMTLPRDYISTEDINTILLELTEEVCLDCRRKGLLGAVVTIDCLCSPFETPTGFSRQIKMPDPTNHTNTVFTSVKSLFYVHWNRMPVRRVGITLSHLTSEKEYQLSLFADFEKLRALDYAADAIKSRFGNSALLRAASLAYEGQALTRVKKIGGHYK